MKIDEEEYMAHYGTPRHSGRYPWGSSGWGDGGTPYDQRNPTLLNRIDELKKQGLTEKEIAAGMGMTIIQLRAERSNAKAQKKQADIAMATRLNEKGLSYVAGAARMGIPESTYRTLLRPGEMEKAKIIDKTSEILKNRVDEVKFLEIGRGTENRMGVTSNKLKSAIEVLKAQGYQVHKVQDPQVLTGHKTNLIVLTPPGVTQKEAWQATMNNQLHIIDEVSDDHGRTFYGTHPPLKISPKRLQIVYGPEGGKADGMIYVRRNVEDVSLGGANYAQVRVAIGPGHYMKGMAMYSDDLPDGVDLQFHTAKHDTGNKIDALKPISDDPKNPFGTFIDRQIVEHPNSPDEKVTSAMNIVNEEGEWSTWSKRLSSQMLSKQSPALAKSQLDLTYERRENDFKNIMELTNPVVKKKLLETFAEATDNAAVQLHAAALPRQGIHVILPVSSMPVNQVYAPNYFPGESVVLIRYPHGGTFEIPRLTVTHRQSEAKKLLGNSRDAIGINHEVAKRLSGADFDGDTVMVIPDPQGRIKDTPALEGLRDFDPISAYGKAEPGHEMSKENTQKEMGKISNLITDMSIQGAPIEEITRAIKHSMVVIDAEKHGLNYKLSYNDNNIAELKRKYQTGGASTLISRRKSEERIPARALRSYGQGGPFDPATGRKVWVPTNEVIRTGPKAGELRRVRVSKLAEAVDARTLMSGPNHTGTPMERLYAEHSNKLKDLANRARYESLRTPKFQQSPTARATYSNEVASLNAKVDLVRRRAPVERKAQRIAKSEVKERKAYNPDMKKATLNKIEYQALEKARASLGIQKEKFEITQKEWDAIQAGAISASRLSELLRYADIEHVRKLATPKTQILMTPTATARAKTMAAQGYTRAEIAQTLGVSVSTLESSIAGET